MKVRCTRAIVVKKLGGWHATMMWTMHLIHIVIDETPPIWPELGIGPPGIMLILLYRSRRKGTISL